MEGPQIKRRNSNGINRSRRVTESDDERRLQQFPVFGVIRQENPGKKVGSVANASNGGAVIIAAVVSRLAPAPACFRLPGVATRNARRSMPEMLSAV